MKKRYISLCLLALVTFQFATSSLIETKDNAIRIPNPFEEDDPGFLHTEKRG